MAKKVLVLTLISLLVLSLGVFGAKKPGENKIKPADKSIVSQYLLTTEPKILFPATDDTAGFTYYDSQHDDVQRRMIVNGPDSIIHFTWMNLVGFDMGSNRYVDYNSYDCTNPPCWLVDDGMHVTDPKYRAGYTGLDLLPDDREVLCYHRLYYLPTPEAYWGTTISIEETEPGLGELWNLTYDIPDSVEGQDEKGLWSTLGCSKIMNGDTAFIHITHAQGINCGDDDEKYPYGSPDNRDLGYVRCFEDPTRDDTLVCESPGWSTPLEISAKTRLVPNKVPYRFAIANLGGTAVATSPVSQKTCITWLQNTVSHLYTKNEVMYIESTNNGNNWMTAGYMIPVQITDYAAEGYQDRAFPDIAAVYDYNDELHIMWTTYRSTNQNDVSLWHWSPTTDIRKADSATASSDVHPGVWNLLIAKMTIGVWPDSNYLYCVYTKFSDDDLAANQYANGDLHVKASTNGGWTWPLEVNLTNTNTNGCTPGNCLSEHWASIAERVDDSLHIIYIEDKDAGAVPQGEGTFTNNAVRYLKVPRPTIPAHASIYWNPPMKMASVSNGGTAYDSLLFYNFGTATLYVKISGPPYVTITPDSFTILEIEPTQIVARTFNGTGLQDTILIDSLLVASNHCLEGGGEIYADTKWVKTHFVVSDNSYRIEHDTVNTNLGAGTDGIITKVSNVGDLGDIGDNSGMFYNGNNYLWDCSPVIIADIPGYGWSGASWIHHRNDFLPESHLEVNNCNGLRSTRVKSTFAPISPTLSPPYHWFWWWWTIVDKSLFFWKPAGPPTPPIHYERAILKYIKLVKNPPPPWWCHIEPDPPTLPSVYLGFAADWDIPYGDHLNNTGGYDETKNLIWIKGEDTYENYYGAFLFYYTAKDGDTTRLPIGANVLTNATQLWPFYGYNDDSLYKYMSTPGYSIESSVPQDMNILMSAIHLDNPDTTTEVTMKYALLITDQGKADLDNLVAQFRRVKCGDANVDGSVSVSDVVYEINYLFKGGPEPWLYFSDVNGDCTESVSDVVYKINYLFKGGPAPRCDCPECAL